MAPILADLAVLAQVLMIDLVLAGDNAIVIAVAVVRLPERQKKRAIMIGVGAAAFVRIVLALLALRLLEVIGLTLAGGILLLYVAWKSWREFRQPINEVRTIGPARLRAAAARIILADLSMSLDNVLAVAGAARDHPALLAIGLVVSVALMALVANVVASLLSRYRWLVWIGLGIVLYVALNMIHGGAIQLSTRMAYRLPAWFM
jgi:YjbE family integral membrane protein